jgi:hypothetical protein
MSGAGEGFCSGGDVEEIIGERLMAPYDVEQAAPARKEYAPHDELEYLLEVYQPYGLRGEDVDAIVAALQEDTGFVCGHDAGGCWYMMSANPRGKWDGWRPRSLRSLQNDSWPTTASLPEGLYPAAVVTPDGVWHDMEARWNIMDEQQMALRARIADLRAHYRAHVAAMLQRHS